ncbi:MAG TPA: flagellar motor protein MotB [Geothrix sp.]|jgi:chemotaxis protein MotB|nr:flagellar motor protein MotB [Geothrix sp.]
MADQAAPEIKIKYVKKRGGHGAAHGGAWKVAYADFVTAMMAFFLLMWLLNSANPNTKAGIAGMFQDPNFFNTERGKEILAEHGKGILPGGRGMAPGPDGEGGTDTNAVNPGAAKLEQEALESTAESIEKAFQQDELLQAFQDQISMDFTDEGLRIQIQDKAAQALFDSGSANLKPYTLSILKEIAKELGKLPNRVVIGGHTDAAQYANKAYTNWELSADRANAARRVMESVSGGLRPNQVRRVTGYADTIPLEGKDPKDPQNRRISIVVVSAASEAIESRHQKTVPRELTGEK